jgi:hypothetical protein
MKTAKLPLVVLSALALCVVVGGCDRTISKKESTSTSSDGTVKSKETTVTEKSDGTVVKKEETTKTTPDKP